MSPAPAPTPQARGLLDGRGSRRLGGSTALKAAIARAPVKSASKAKQSALWSFDVEQVPAHTPRLVLQHSMERNMMGVLFRCGRGWAAAVPSLKKQHGSQKNM